MNSFLETRKLDKLQQNHRYLPILTLLAGTTGNLRAAAFAKSERPRSTAMDTLLNIKAFLASARAGSFSAAARQLGVAPSVVVKRINRLED